MKRTYLNIYVFLYARCMHQSSWTYMKLDPYIYASYICYAYKGTVYMPYTFWGIYVGVQLHVCTHYVYVQERHICIPYITIYVLHIQCVIYFCIYVVCFHFHTWNCAYLFKFQKHKIWTSVKINIIFIEILAVFPSEPYLCQFAVHGNSQLATCGLQQLLNLCFYKKDKRNYHMNSSCTNDRDNKLWPYNKTRRAVKAWGHYVPVYC